MGEPGLISTSIFGSAGVVISIRGFISTGIGAVAPVV